MQYTFICSCSSLLRHTPVCTINGSVALRRGFISISLNFFFNKQDEHIRTIEHKTFFIHKVFYVHLLYISAAVGIEPIALRLEAQNLAAELSANAFTQCFTELGKKTLQKNCCWRLLRGNYRRKVYSDYF